MAKPIYIHLVKGHFMSEFIKTQEEIRANLTAQIREVLDFAEESKRGLDQSELEKIDRIEADITRADEALEVARRNATRAAEAAEASRGFVPATEARGDAEIFRAMARGEIREHSFSMEKRATLIPSVNTVPVAFLDRVYSLARLVGPYLETSEVFQRDSGEDLRIPVMTGYATATESAAGSAIDESEPTYSSLLLSMTKQGFIVKLANELISDAGFGLEENIAEQAGNAIGTRANVLIHAAVTAVAGAGVTAGTSNAITADELIDLQFSVNGAVRMLPGTGYMVNSSTLGAIRKLKDNNGQYILDVVAGGPSTILGLPVIENPAVAAIGTAGGTKPVFFGHWPSVKVSTTGLQVAVSTDAYFANDVTGYRFTYRLGQGVANGADHIKVLTMASV
jgi:HK97 family phage major capsid protein